MTDNNDRRPWRRGALPRGQTRVHRAGGRTGAYRLTIPASIGKLLGDDVVFQAELVDEGILFRYVSGGTPKASPLPDWLVHGAATPGAYGDGGS